MSSTSVWAPARSIVRITESPGELERIVTIAVATEAGQAVLSVADTGPGLSPETEARLFEPFFRGGQVPVKKGHGLGLAIARQIVVNHHGRIDAENRREGGLRVTVRLPRASPETGA